ncbi:MAG: hypothetical protein CMB38_01755 [Euryarchaeota archaeon]|nr:hypothetical protein [Euryarchaeota archaeon]DAC33971.1 MAG TPA: hypothetical protein D7I05_05075 [Candidatus Poseidoniales archaeon]
MPFPRGRSNIADVATSFAPVTPLERLSVLTLRMSASTLETIKTLTTEALEPLERETFLSDLASAHGRGVFEISTCNRVMYAGMAEDIEQLRASVEQTTGIVLDSVSEFSGKDAWEHLVMVTSGLDAFVLGELQVLGQMRTAIERHRQSEDVDSELVRLLEQVVWASRLVRKQLGFTRTTTSMLNLATWSLDEMVNEETVLSCVVLGSGDMGRKAVEALLERDVGVTVVSRQPERARDRLGNLAERVNFIDFDQWTNAPPPASLVISTLRVAKPAYGPEHPLPTQAPLTVMDFSWPPSIDEGGLHAGQVLQGMNHWIRQAHGLEAAIDRPALLAKAKLELAKIEAQLDLQLTAASQSDFRSLVHHTLATLAKEWSESPLNVPPQNATLEAFGRELATWMCKVHGQATLDDVRERIRSTTRPISPALLERVEDDLVRVIGDLHTHLPPSEVRP